MSPGRALRWGAAMAYAAGIFALSSQSGITAPEVVPNFDKVCHAVEYAGFTWVLALALEAGGSPLVAPRAALLATLYGASDEYHQRFTPGRDASAWDVAAD
ncbi:MAG: teicoplanin resistance protein VanZ, partial [Nitrospirae bacterium]